MPDEDHPRQSDACAPEPLPGDLARLLREIEKEPVPQRLLELALELQAALAQRRGQSGGGTEPDGA